MAISVEEFDAPKYYEDIIYKKQNNVFSNDTLRAYVTSGGAQSSGGKSTGKTVMVDYKRKIMEYICGEDGPIAKGLIHTFIP